MLAAVSMATLPPFGHSTHESVSHLGGLKVIFDEGFDRWRPVFLGSVWQRWGWPKGFTLPPTSTSVCPQLLGEPQCTYGGIPDTTLKQQGTKQQQPDSWSFLVKEQAGQRSSSRLLIPPALWDCRARLYSQCKAKHMPRARRINYAQSVHCFSAQAWAWVSPMQKVESTPYHEHSRAAYLAGLKMMPLHSSHNLRWCLILLYENLNIVIMCKINRWISIYPPAQYP